MNQGSESDSEHTRRVKVGRIILLVIALFVVFGLGSRLDSWTSPSPIELGNADELALTTFDGKAVKLSDLQGTGVLVNFWASWCGPCQAEAPILEQRWRQASDNGIVFLGVAVQDTESQARRFVQEKGLTFPTGLDADGAWERAFGVSGLPETIFIDPSGQVVDRVRGPIVSRRVLDQLLRRIQP